MEPIEIVWLALDLDAPQLERGREWLSIHELARADRYVDAAHGARYVAAHAQLRWLLGRRLGAPPGRLAFERGPHGKPGIPGAPLRFSLSHSGRWALVAMHPTLELGVDVETAARSRNWLGLAERFFTAGECAGLRALPREDVPAQFCRIWACKEAWMKADGRGLAAGVATAEVQLAREPAGIAAPSPPGTRTFCRELAPRSGYAAAVVAFVPTAEPDPEVTAAVLPPPL